MVALRNLLEVADVIARSTLSRHESRGPHHTLDYPELAEETVDTVLVTKRHGSAMGRRRTLRHAIKPSR